jgi:hypothetical protein
MNVDLKLNNVEIDIETADRIVVAVMFDQYSILKQEIKEQKTIENPLDYQKEDLKYNEKFLDAVKTMLKHYIAQSDWPEELKGDKL